MSLKRRRIGAYVSGGVNIFGKLSAQGTMGGMYDNTVSGYGDYKIRGNVLYPGAGIPHVRNPSITSNATVISHKEYLGDIITSGTAGAFNIQGWSLNPGLSTTFEWLAQIAQNYEQYIFEGVIFCYRSMSGNALTSTNTALGTVIMATQYNPLNPAFSSKAEMESYQFAVSFKPSESHIHPIECNPNETPLPEMYIRTGAIPSGTDARLYDLGTTYIATQGFQGTNVNIGELWVTYQVALLKPKLFASLGLGIDYMRLYKATTVIAATPLGVNASTGITYNNASISVNDSGVVTLPSYGFPTTYWVGYESFMSGVASVVPSLTFINQTNCSSVALDAAPTPSTDTGKCWYVARRVKTNGGNVPTYFQLNWAGFYSGWGTGNVGCFFTVMQIPNDTPLA